MTRFGHELDPDREIDRSLGDAGQLVAGGEDKELVDAGEERSRDIGADLDRERAVGAGRFATGDDRRFGIGGTGVSPVDGDRPCSLTLPASKPETMVGRGCSRDRLRPLARGTEQG